MRKDRSWSVVETLTTIAIAVIITTIIYPLAAKAWPVYHWTAVGVAALVVAAGTTLIVLACMLLEHAFPGSKESNRR